MFGALLSLYTPARPCGLLVNLFLRDLDQRFHHSFEARERRV